MHTYVTCMLRWNWTIFINTDMHTIYIYIYIYIYTHTHTHTHAHTHTYMHIYTQDQEVFLPGDSTKPWREVSFWSRQMQRWLIDRLWSYAHTNTCIYVIVCAHTNTCVHTYKWLFLGRTAACSTLRTQGVCEYFQCKNIIKEIQDYSALHVPKMFVNTYSAKNMQRLGVLHFNSCMYLPWICIHLLFFSIAPWEGQRNSKS